MNTCQETPSLVLINETKGQALTNSSVPMPASLCWFMPPDLQLQCRLIATLGKCEAARALETTGVEDCCTNFSSK